MLTNGELKKMKDDLKKQAIETSKKIVENYTVKRYELFDDYYLEITSAEECNRIYMEAWLCGEYSKRLIDESYWDGSTEEFIERVIGWIDVDIEMFETYEGLIRAFEGFEDED